MRPSAPALALLAISSAYARYCTKDDVVSESSGSWDLQGCVSLRLEMQAVGVAGAHALANALAAGTGKQLDSLRLRQAAIGDEGAEALAAALQHSALTELEIWRSGVGPKGCAALAAAAKASEWQVYDHSLHFNGEPVVLHGFGVDCTEYMLRTIGTKCFAQVNWNDPASVITELN